MFKSVIKKRSIFPRIAIVLGVALILGVIGFKYNYVSADTINSKPAFNVQINSMTPNPAKVGEDITVTGNIVPQPFGNNIQKKQIVLVLDTSGSMADNNKIVNMKAAAQNFVETMKSISNVEIAIVEFSSRSVINPGKSTSDITVYSNTVKGYDRYGRATYYGGAAPNYPNGEEKFYSLNEASNVTTVEGFISNLQAKGGTNSGEGLRKAAYMLSQKGDSEAIKSIVFMSDGMPTYYSAVGTSTTKFYTTIDDTNPNIAGIGNDSDSNNVTTSANYATTIGSKIKDLVPNLKVFTIGYGLGNEYTTGNKTMKGIHTSMGGDLNDGTFFATDENAIDGVFNSIADKIINSYTISDMQIDVSSAVNFSTAFSLISGDETIDVRNVNYTRDLTDMSRVIYRADPIPFTFTIHGNIQGDYHNLFDGTKVNFTWNGGTLSSNSFSNKDISIVYNPIPSINAKIVSQSPNPAARTDNITLSAQITPQSFELSSTSFDESGPKDVMLLVDTSKSMSEEITSLKNGLFGKIVNDSSIQNTKYGIITFNSSIKYDYVSGFSNNVGDLDSAIKNINCSSSDDVRNLGDAMDKAREIFANSGRTNSAKYIIIIASGDVTYTNEQLFNMESSNCKSITVDLGNITQPYMQDNVVVPGATEPTDNIKNLHYNLIGKSDGGDNVLQKAAKGYYMNVNYSLITNKTNPDEFFSKMENANQMDGPNEIHNWILPLVAKQLEGATAQVTTQSYNFDAALKFNLQDLFTNISGLSSITDSNYNVQTPDCNVHYTLQNGKYVADTVNNVSFTIKINSNVDISNGLKFGPGVISYENLGNQTVNNTIAAFPLNLKASIQLGNHGVYRGVINQSPQIIDGSSQVFTFSKEANVNFGATLKGSLNSSTGIKLQLANELTLTSNPIKVYTYDDLGNLTQTGTMEKSTSDSDLTTYVYKGNDIVDKNILILYNQKMPSDSSKSQFTNKLITPDGEKDVNIKISGELPELF